MKATENPYDVGRQVMADFINKAAKKEEEFILSVYKKQEGFISIEESKHLIEVNRMMKDTELMGTDYLFNGKCILTIYPPEFTEENMMFKVTNKYIEH